MIDIDYLKYQDQLKIKTIDNKRCIFDPLRQKYLVLQPEELVRQLMLIYFIQEKAYLKNRISIERGIQVNTLKKRCDILIYDLDMNPFLLVECKAPAVKINQAVFEQIARYNLPLQVPYLLVSNGQKTYCCAMDYEANSFSFLTEIPDFPTS